jgi:hypothetical protein
MSVPKLPDPIPVAPIRETLREGEDWDVAEYKLGICLGMFPAEDGRFEYFRRNKHLWWLTHPIGSALHDILNRLVSIGVLEFNDDEQQYRWNAGFDILQS